MTTESAHPASQTSPNDTNPAVEALQRIMATPGIVPSQHIPVEGADVEATQTDATEGGGDQQQEQEQAQPNTSGAQQRINELTAARRDAERRAEAIAAQNAELMQTVTQLMNRQLVQSTLVEPSPEEKEAMAALEQMDAPTKRAFELMLRRAVGGVEQKLSRVVNELEVARVGGIRAKYSDETNQRADELISTWRQNGHTGWVLKDALIYAAGAMVEEGKNPLRQANQTPPPKKQQGNNPDVIAGRAGAPMASFGGSAKTPPKYTNVGTPDYDPKKAAAFWESKLGDAKF